MTKVLFAVIVLSSFTANAAVVKMKLGLIEYNSQKTPAIKKQIIDTAVELKYVGEGVLDGGFYLHPVPSKKTFYIAVGATWIVSEPKVHYGFSAGYHGASDTFYNHVELDMDLNQSLNGIITVASPFYSEEDGSDSQVTVEIMELRTAP